MWYSVGRTALSRQSRWCAAGLLAGCRGGVLARNASRACFKNKVARKRGARQPAAHKLMIGAELRDIFSANRMIAVYHHNDLTTAEWNALRLRLADVGVKVRVLPSKVARKALEETKHRDISILFQGSTAIAYGKDGATLAPLMSSLKSEGKLLLLGGLVDDQMFTPKELKNIAALPAIEVLRSKLVGLLTLPQLMLTQLVQATPQRLSSLLGRVVDTESEG